MTSEPSSDGQVQLHYRKLAEHLPNSVVFILDRDLHVVFAGGSLMSKSRWTRDALVGKALRQHGVRTPVILLSGHSAGEERAGLAEAGVAAWLDKPPSSWLLAKAVAAALGRE